MIEATKTTLSEWLDFVREGQKVSIALSRYPDTIAVAVTGVENVTAIHQALSNIRPLASPTTQPSD